MGERLTRQRRAAWRGDAVLGLRKEWSADLKSALDECDLLEGELEKSRNYSKGMDRICDELQHRHLSRLRSIHDRIISCQFYADDPGEALDDILKELVRWGATTDE